MRYYKYINGTKWLLLFFHDFSKVGFLSQSDAKECYKYEEGKYSILSHLNEKDRYEQYFEFMIEYPDLDYIWWKQKYNPITQEEKSTDTLESLDVHFKHNPYVYFKGLLKSSNQGQSFLDGDAHQLSDYWYSIGTISWVLSPIPGPYISDNDRRTVDCVWLWLRVPGESYNFSIAFSKCMIFSIMNLLFNKK